jgi:hypothetical protein
MLKIKDNVDLKELEKYGFKFHEEYYDENGNLKYYFAGQNLYIFEKENGEFDRSFDNTDYGFSMYDIDLLYDLIKADLVEKVDA